MLLKELAIIVIYCLRIREREIVGLLVLVNGCPFLGFMFTCNNYKRFGTSI